MKMKYFKLMVPVVLVLLMAACTGIKVTTDYDKKADFGKYKTFNFSREVDKVKLSDLNRRRLKDDIRVQMEAKGYQLSTSPDLLVNVFVKGITKFTANAYTNGYGGPWGWGYYGWGMGSSNTWVDVDRYTEGTMFIDLIDVQKKEMVWEGIAEGMINPRTHTTEQHLNDVVARIFKDFPH
jgi:hypothetical protein